MVSGALHLTEQTHEDIIDEIDFVFSDHKDKKQKTISNVRRSHSVK